MPQNFSKQQKITRQRYRINYLFTKQPLAATLHITIFNVGPRLMRDFYDVDKTFLSLRVWISGKFNKHQDIFSDHSQSLGCKWCTACMCSSVISHFQVCHKSQSEEDTQKSSLEDKFDIIMRLISEMFSCVSRWRKEFRSYNKKINCG